MSATVWPPISPEQLIKEEEDTLAAELEWLLDLLQENLASLKSGLQECVALLAPQEPGSTLALSSLRSESVKGFVTRVGTRIVKEDVSLRLPSLPHSPQLLHLANPLPLPQLTHLITLLNQSLDIIDISAWTGDPQNPTFIASQLKLLHDTLLEAASTLKGADSDSIHGGKWFEQSYDESTFSPPLPEMLAVHLSIVDAALVLHVRTLVPASTQQDSGLSLSGLSIRARLGLTAKLPVHDEAGDVFGWKGEEVCVREKIRVESPDPSLLAVMAKLSALGHAVAGWRLRVAVVMGQEVE